jgi:integrase
MFRTPSYLQKTRTGIYHFRIRVPKDLHQHFLSTILTKSLGTGCRQEALKYARVFAIQVEGQFDSLRGKQMAETKYNKMDLFVKRMVQHPDGRIEVEGIQTDPDKSSKEEVETFQGMVKALGNAQKATPTSRPAPFPTTPLKDVIEAFCNEKKVEGAWDEKTESEARAAFNLFFRIVGEIRLNEIGHDTARHYKQTIQKLPSNMNKKALYREKSIKDIVAMEPEDTMAIKTMNKNLNRMSSLFDWAKKQGYVSDNYFSDLTLTDKRQAHEKKDIFSKEDLELIFSNQIFAKKVFNHSYYYWLPLLALYTGARINEICQLHLDDIRQEDDVWVFDINDNLEKKLKNPSSKRLIPIHSKLFDFGLLKYIKRLQTKGEAMLFPELIKRRDGYATDASRWFGRFRIKIGVTAKEKTFHSFRHTVADSLKQLGNDDKQVAAILGHSGSSITFDLYGKPFKPPILKPVIEQLEFNTELINVKKWK